MFQKIKNKAQEKYNNIVNKSDKKEEVQQPPHIELEEEPQKPQNLEIKQDGIIQDNNNIQNTPVKKKEGALDKLKQKYQEASGYVQGKVNDAQLSVKTQFQKVDQSVTQTILKHKQNINKWIAAKADQKLQKQLKKMEPKIIASVEKSVPSQCVKGFVNDALLNMWKDITDLIRFELKVKLQEPQIELSKRPDSVRWLKPWYALRNWILYALQPYNLDYGDQVKRFSFILLKVLQAIPYFGIQAFTFFIVYLAIDKSEEYQIVYFILDYKNMQFFTAGCLTAIIGYIQYFHCATLQPSEKIDQKFQENYCFEDGPGMSQNLIISQIIKWHFKKKVSLLLSFQVELLFMLNKFEECCQQADNAIAMIPNFKEVYIIKAELLRLHNKFKESILVADQALAIQKNYKEALTSKAESLRMLNRFQESIEYADQAILIDPNYQEALYSKAESLRMKGKEKESIQYVDKAIAIDPNHKQALTLKAELLRQQRKYIESLSYTDRVLDKDPYFASALAIKATSLIKLKKYKDAELLLSKALQVNPNDQFAKKKKGKFRNSFYQSSAI